MKILVIAAHPDDEVLGMGGTIKKLSTSGNEIKTIFLATGMGGGINDNYLIFKKINNKIKIFLEVF